MPRVSAMCAELSASKVSCDSESRTARALARADETAPVIDDGSASLPTTRLTMSRAVVAPSVGIDSASSRIRAASASGTDRSSMSSWWCSASRRAVASARSM